GREDRTHEVQVLRHRLPPRLGKPFGGSPGPLYVSAVRNPHYRAPRPDANLRLTHSNFAPAADQPGVLDDHSKRDSAPEVENLLCLDVILLISSEPILEEAANRGPALEHAQLSDVPHSIGGVDAHRRGNVAPVHG